MNCFETFIRSYKASKFNVHINSLIEDYKMLQKENEYLREELNISDELSEITKYKNEINYIHKHSLLQFSDKELERHRAFKERHNKSCGNISCYVYEITGTGIGSVIKIACPICREVEDITDISSW